MYYVYKESFFSVIRCFLFFVFFSSQFLYVKYGLIEFQFVTMLVGFISVIFVCNKASKDFFVFVFLLSFFSVVTTLISGKFKIGDVVFSLTMPFFGMFMVMYKDNMKVPALIFLFFVIAYCGGAIVSGVNLNTELFNASSRNYISVLAIFSFFAYCISNGNNKLFQLFFLVLVFLLALFSNSRSALFSFLILVFGFFWGGWRSNRRMCVVILAFFTPFLVYWLLSNGDEFFSSLGVFNRLSAASVSDDGRGAVLSCYAHNFDVKYLFLGLDALGDLKCSYLANGTDNPHNSFIRLLSNVGFFSFVVIFFIFYSMYAFARKKEILMLSFFLAFLVRGATDIIFFFQSWDAYLWALVIVALPTMFIRKSALISFEK